MQLPKLQMGSVHKACTFQVRKCNLADESVAARLECLPLNRDRSYRLAKRVRDRRVVLIDSGDRERGPVVEKRCFALLIFSADRHSTMLQNFAQTHEAMHRSQLRQRSPRTSLRVGVEWVLPAVRLLTGSVLW